MEMEQGCLAPLAREIRRAVTIPVSVAGRISDPHVAERILEAGDADFGAPGRARRGGGRGGGGGGGPAGLEAARVLALRGHAVTVLERAAEPGGQVLMSR